MHRWLQAVQDQGAQHWPAPPAGGIYQLKCWYCWWKKSGQPVDRSFYPMIFHIVIGGAGFLPSVSPINILKDHESVWHATYFTNSEWNCDCKGSLGWNWWKNPGEGNGNMEVLEVFGSWRTCSASCRSFSALSRSLSCFGSSFHMNSHVNYYSKSFRYECFFFRY